MNSMAKASPLRTSFFTLLLTFTLMFTLTNPAQSTTVYKKVDEQGNLVFSDEPFEGAEALEVKPVTTINLNIPPEALQKQIPTASPLPPTEQTNYTSLSITSPTHNSSLVNTGGIGAITIESVPALKKGNLYTLLLNGEKKGTQRSTTFGLKGLIRGAHTAVVQIVSEKTGEVFKVSAPVTFYVRQHSIKH